jgi:hypothetical protein
MLNEMKKGPQSQLHLPCDSEEEGENRSISYDEKLQLILDIDNLPVENWIKLYR